MERMGIGEVATRAGITPSAIRFYEEQGLVPAPVRVGGKRRYGPDALTRLALIRLAQDAGLSIRDIRELVNGYDETVAPGDRWRDIARSRLPELDATIARLSATRDTLTATLACSCRTLDECATNRCASPSPTTDSIGLRPIE